MAVLRILRIITVNFNISPTPFQNYCSNSDPSYKAWSWAPRFRLTKLQPYFTRIPDAQTEVQLLLFLLYKRQTKERKTSCMTHDSQKL